jgi:3-phenylpropionate/trans-cinnamate dioxygenase ferredoxin subunit
MMDGFIEVANADAFSDGEMRQVGIDGHELLVAKVGERFFVADARCPHMHGHLARGTLEGTIVTCPRHHSQFDLSDGRCVRWTDWKGIANTMAELVRHPRPLRVYQIEVLGGKVFVGPEKKPVAAPPVAVLTSR